jgi:hypothetical protein
MPENRKQIISKEPWWANPPVHGQREESIEWGYLLMFSDGTWVFDDTRPSKEEIMGRKSCRLPVGE